MESAKKVSYGGHGGANKQLIDWLDLFFTSDKRIGLASTFGQYNMGVTIFSFFFSFKFAGILGVG
jgi:hypothetical protein